MSQEDKLSTKNQNITSDVGAAAVGGGGVGTLIMSIAQLLDETNQLRDVLTFTAPTISVGVSSLWIWALGVRKNHINKKQKTEVLENTRKRLNEILNDPCSDEDMKKFARENLLMLEQKWLENNLKVYQS